MGPPHTPQLNGVAERYNRTLLDRLKPSLKHSALHQEFWSHALEYAVWTTNRSPTRTNEGFKTPYEVYHGDLPSMHHAHIFGAKGQYFVPSENRDKLDNHTRDCYFLSVLPHGDGVKVLDAKTRKVVKTRDAQFDEHVNHDQTTHTPPVLPSSINQSSNDNTSPWLLPDTESHPTQPTAEDVEFQEPRPRRTRAVPERFGDLQAHSASVEKSRTYRVAMASSEKEEWNKAMKVEINSFIDRNVFTLVPRPAGRKIISCRWHLKKKFNPDGSIQKFKARLVARGFTQREGIDYQETFAPSSRQESLKAFLAINWHRDWEVIKLDVVGAFLYGELDEEVYLSQPEGFINPEFPNHVWRLNSSLYGLKQSARQWYQCLADHLKTIGFAATQADPTMYVLKQEEEITATIVVHVDDILLAGNDSTISTVEKLLRDRFKLTKNEDMSHFLSFDITRNRKTKTFTMNQASYVHDLVEQHHLEDARRVYTPCDDHFKYLTKNVDPTKTTNHPYCSLIGALLWLSNGTRPDITFAVNRLSSFMTSPTDEHWREAQSVLVYARDTADYLITLGGSDLKLTGHSDSDWAEQREDRRSTTGFVFCLGPSPVSWRSKRQPTIALSSTEAEYMALTDASREAIWWRSILNELTTVDLSIPTVLHYGNKGAGELALNPCHHSRSKHIDVKHHFIRECISSSIIKLQQVPTLSMIADMLTKPLKKPRHIANVKMMFKA